MRGLRSSIDRLRTSDSEAADDLAAINHDLEVLTSTCGDDAPQQGLLDDRDTGKLITQIQTLKGFESFLKPAPFDNLRSAAVRGP